MKFGKLIQNVTLLAAGFSCFGAFASNLYGPIVNLDSCTTILNEVYLNPWPKAADNKGRPACGLASEGEKSIYCERAAARIASRFKIDLQNQTCDSLLDYQDLITGAQYRSMHVSCKVYGNQMNQIDHRVLVAFANTDRVLGNRGQLQFRIDGANWLHRDLSPLTPDGYLIAIQSAEQPDHSHLSGYLNYGIRATYTNGTIVPNDPAGTCN